MPNAIPYETRTVSQYNPSRSPMASLFWAMLLVLSLTLHSGSRVSGQRKAEVGVCYGFNGDNLPPPKDVVSLYQNYGIKKMRIFEPDPGVLEALRGSGISLTLGVRNQDIPSLASGEDAAHAWFVNNVRSYISDVDIPYISVGNEVIPGEFSESILPAMQNLQHVLRKNCLGM